VLPLKLVSPLYWAVRVRDPPVEKVIEQLPVCAAVSVAVQDSRVLAVTVTEPVGPTPGPATVKLIVTACCRADGLGLFEVIVVVLAALLTLRLAVPVVVPEVAMIAAVPRPTPDARPLALTVAIEVADEDQLTRLLMLAVVPSVYVPVALNCTLDP